ncbi:MAG: hypothetical protein K2W95_00300 [Candidatus Obscuribacterales bacterium]|nr:hypothetical protein [Candidatus Obscuribacterales bacterium]
MFQQSHDKASSENQPSSGQEQKTSTTPPTRNFEPPPATVASEKILTEPKSPYPLSDEAYDMVSLLYHKSKALQVYDKYLQDLRGDNQIRHLLLQIRSDEERHLEGLKNHLGRLLVNPPNASTDTTSTTSPGD